MKEVWQNRQKEVQQYWKDYSSTEAETEKKLIMGDVRHTHINDTLQLIWSVMNVMDDPFAERYWGTPFKQRAFQRIRADDMIWSHMYPEIMRHPLTQVSGFVRRFVAEDLLIRAIICSFLDFFPAMFHLFRQVPVKTSFTCGEHSVKSHVVLAYATNWWLNRNDSSNKLMMPHLTLKMPTVKMDELQITIHSWTLHMSFEEESSHRPCITVPKATTLVAKKSTWLPIKQRDGKKTNLEVTCRLNLHNWAESIRGYLDRINGMRGLSEFFFSHSNWRHASGVAARLQRNGVKDDKRDRSFDLFVRKSVAAFLR